MAAEHPDDLVTLLVAAAEFEAEAIAEALQEAGIPAFAFAGMRASLPINSPFTQAIVQVREGDLERAKEMLATIRAEAAAIDWSEVDEADPATGDGLRGYPPIRREALEPPYQPRRRWVQNAFKIMAIIMLMWFALYLFGVIRLVMFGR